MTHFESRQRASMISASVNIYTIMRIARTLHSATLVLVTLSMYHIEFCARTCHDVTMARYSGKYFINFPKWRGLIL